ADGCELVDLRARRATQLESDEGKRLALAGRALLATRERSDDLARKVFAVACGVPVEDVERIPTPDVPGLVEVVGAGVDFLCLSTLVERVPSDPFLRAVTSLVREARGGGPTIVNVDAWA
ncbi:MAG TPA: hypothetical protein VD864_13100, partial [Nocardioides sp.]|nr:hypothetical protein [Nocardioides sp.]